MSPVLEAIQRGMRRGAKLAANPTPENWNELRTVPSSDLMADAWEMMAESFEESIQQVKRDS